MLHEPSTTEEIEQLKDLIERASAELTALINEQKSFQKAVESSLKEYYAHIGPLCEPLLAPLSSPLPSIECIGEPSPVEEEARSLYRKLVKRCHPDTNQGVKEATSLFEAVQTAYKRQDLTGLRSLEWLLSEESTLQAEEDIMLSHLTKQYSLLVQALHQQYQEKKAFMESPAYQLHQKILWAKANNQDFIGQVRDRLYQKLASQEKIVALPLGKEDKNS